MLIVPSAFLIGEICGILACVVSIWVVLGLFFFKLKSCILAEFWVWSVIIDWVFGVFCVQAITKKDANTTAIFAKIVVFLKAIND